MRERRKLIVVSNRGPTTFGRDEHGRLTERRGAGGLVTALRPLVEQHDVTWIASALSEEDRRQAAQGTLECGADGARYRLRLLAHSSHAYDLYYNVVANPVLWFVQHGLDGLHERRFAQLDAAWSDGYAPVNAAFAAAVSEELARQPEAAVLFQDYHLYLAPPMVRRRHPDALMAHFVHIPWPSPAEWAALPASIVRSLHEGLLANDVVSFHTSRWRQAFLDSARALSFEPDGGRICAHPISVDVAEFDELAMSSRVLDRERDLVSKRPEHLILRVDRTDPSKNVVRGFRAYARLLDRRPDLAGRVQMLALLDPSRQSIAEYAEYRVAIEREAAIVEERHPGSLRLRIADDFFESVAAYKQFDVLLVNSVRDGLNLVAKEAPLVNVRSGSVVLSENTGAFEELAPWVIPIDPLDVEEQAAALEHALELPAGERSRRARAIAAHVGEHDLAEWSAALLEDLDRVSTMRA